MNMSDRTIHWNHMLSMTNTRLGPEKVIKNNNFLLLLWIFKLQPNLGLSYSLSLMHTHIHTEKKIFLIREKSFLSPFNR